MCSQSDFSTLAYSISRSCYFNEDGIIHIDGILLAERSTTTVIADLDSVEVRFVSESSSETQGVTVLANKFIVRLVPLVMQVKIIKVVSRINISVQEDVAVNRVTNNGVTRNLDGRVREDVDSRINSFRHTTFNIRSVNH